MVAANVGRAAPGQKRTLTPHLLTPAQYKFAYAAMPLLVGLLLFSCTMLAVMMDTKKAMALSTSQYGLSVSWFATVRQPDLSNPNRVCTSRSWGSCRRNASDQGHVFVWSAVGEALVMLELLLPTSPNPRDLGLWGALAQRPGSATDDRLRIRK
jgi:hypothetical protein